MAFHDTRKNNGYNSIHKVILTCLGGPFFPGHGVVVFIMAATDWSCIG